MPRTICLVLVLAACSAPQVPPMKCESPNVPVAPKIFPLDAEVGAPISFLVGNGALSNCQAFEASAKVEVSDPDNLPLTAEVTSVTHIGIQLTAGIRFTPVKPGFHHVVVTFSNASVAQRDVFVLRKAKGGMPDVLPPGCDRAQPLPHGWICWQGTTGWWHVRGGATQTLKQRTSLSGSAAAADGAVWTTDPQPGSHAASHWVERDGGLAVDPAPLELGTSATGNVLLPSATDAVLVSMGNAWKLRLSGGALTLDTATAAANGASELFLRDGDGYVGFTQSFDGKPGLCRFDFSGLSSCAKVPGARVGLSRDGAWAYQDNTLSLYAFDGSKKADLFISTFQAWPSSTPATGGGVPFGLPIVGRTDSSTFAGTPIGIPVFTDGTLQLERIPGGLGGSFVGASDVAFWWEGAALRR